MTKHMLFPMGLLLVTCLSACQGSGIPLIGGDGSGFVMTLSCHRPEIDDLKILRSATPDGLQFMSPLRLSCYRSDDPFDPASTLSYSSDNRVLPEWIDFTWVPYEKGKKYSDAEYRALLKQPGVTERVYVRQQIPQSVVDKVREARRHQDPSKLPERNLHVYFIWTVEGIKLTWTEEKTEYDSINSPFSYPVAYGGYLPPSFKTPEWLIKAIHYPGHE